jgi:hypothetical protein
VPGAGALLGAVATGWVHRVRRQGRAVIIAVIVWGAAITCFGLAHWPPLALALLAVVTGGPRIGNAESGAVANAFGAPHSMPSHRACGRVAISTIRRSSAVPPSH